MSGEQKLRLQQRYLKALCRDRYFSALSPEAQLRQLEDCLTYAERQAQDLQAALGTVDGSALRGWAGDNGIRIVEVQTKFDLPYLAEYLPLRRAVELYPRRIAEVQQTLSQAEPERFARHSLLEMCLAHELFHALESRDYGKPGRLLCLQVRLLGVFPVRHCIDQGSEIAAHAFVQALLELDFSTYTFFDELAEAYRPARKGTTYE